MSDENIDAITTLLNSHAPEELHPDLLPYLHEHGNIGRIIQHPLIYSVPHFEPLNRLVNRQYAEKTKVRDNARAQGDWSQFIWIHERPYRLDAFCEILDELDDKSYWKFLGSIWTDCENVSQNYDRWMELWFAQRSCRENVMDTDDQNSLQAVPFHLTIYRGFGHKDAVNGLSWTLSKEKAMWFARRHSSMDKTKPRLAVGKISKSSILAYFGGRNEQEVVVFPENVNTVKVTVLREKG